MATSGSVTSGKAKSSYFYINWQLAGQNVANNTSTINYQGGFVIGGGNLWYTNAIKIYSSGTTGGHSGTYSNATSNGTYQKFSGSFTVYHNSDGTASVGIGISGWFYDYGNKSGYSTFSLPTIARKSSPSATTSSVAIGNILHIDTNRASSSFTHTLAYSPNNSTWTTFATSVGASYDWGVPYEIANNYPSATSGTLYIRCTTLNGGSDIGSNTISVTVTIPENSSTKPSINSIPIVDGSTIKPTEFNSKFVQSLSNLKVTPTASGKYSATIARCETTILGTIYTHSVSSSVINSITSKTIASSGNVVVSVKVTDSRGFTNTATNTVTIVPYVLPSITALSAVQEAGKITVSVAGLVSAVDDLNDALLTLQYKTVEASTYDTATVSLSNPYNFSESKEITISGLLATTPYVIIATLNDLYTTKASLSITKGINTNLSVNLAKSGNGYIAIPNNGKVYSLDYVYGVTDSSWDSGIDVDAPSTLSNILYDEELGIMVGYTSDKKIVYSPVNYKTQWKSFDTSEFIIDFCVAGNKVYCLGENRMWCVRQVGSTFGFESHKLPSLGTGDAWKFIAGNDYYIYIISQNGLIYYTKPALPNAYPMDWVQTRLIASTGNAITPTSLAPISSGQFYATANSLIALINTVSGYGVYVTPTISYR